MRSLSNANPEQAKATGWVVDAGDPSAWECVVKAHSADMMKSTKRMKVEGGWLYQVTTEGPLGYAEALVFVPSLNWEVWSRGLSPVGTLPPVSY